jgi:hypothetical protein
MESLGECGAYGQRAQDDMPQSAWLGMHHLSRPV